MEGGGGQGQKASERRTGRQAETSRLAETSRDRKGGIRQTGGGRQKGKQGDSIEAQTSLSACLLSVCHGRD